MPGGQPLGHQGTRTAPSPARVGAIALAAAIIEQARWDVAEGPGERRPPRYRGVLPRPSARTCPSEGGRPHQRHECAVEYLAWLQGVTAAIAPTDRHVGDGTAEEIALRVLSQVVPITY